MRNVWNISSLYLHRDLLCERGSWSGVNQMDFIQHYLKQGKVVYSFLLITCCCDNVDEQNKRCSNEFYRWNKGQ